MLSEELIVAKSLSIGRSVIYTAGSCVLGSACYLKFKFLKDRFLVRIWVGHVYLLSKITTKASDILRYNLSIASYI